MRNKSHRRFGNVGAPRYWIASKVAMSSIDIVEGVPKAKDSTARSMPIEKRDSAILGPTTTPHRQLQHRRHHRRIPASPA